MKPQIYLTTGYDQNNVRFGDPHAIFNGIYSGAREPNLVQVAGFLSITSNNPLRDVIDKAKNPFE